MNRLPLIITNRAIAPTLLLCGWMSILSFFLPQQAFCGPKPPVILRKHTDWWHQSNRPKPVQGWDSFVQNIKQQNPLVKQAVDDKGTLIFLLHMRVNKKGVVDFAEVWDSNSKDSALNSSLSPMIVGSAFTPYLTIDGKRIKESSLVLMEIPGNAQQLTTQPQDTTLPNKEITSARFLGGYDAFQNYIIQEFEYPSRCMEKKISGYVRMRFMVDRNGVVTSCRIKETSQQCPEFALEAIRVLKACPKWVPATHEGKNISAWFEVPISLNVE